MKNVNSLAETPIKREADTQSRKRNKDEMHCLTIVFGDDRVVRTITWIHVKVVEIF